jgi:hypothetical protein
LEDKCETRRFGVLSAGRIGGISRGQAGNRPNPYDAWKPTSGWSKAPTTPLEVQLEKRPLNVCCNAATIRPQHPKSADDSGDALAVQIKMVAGTEFEPVTFRL